MQDGCYLKDGCEERLPPPADVVADEIAGAQQQLEDGIGQRPRVDVPEFHHPLSQGMPTDAAYAGLLSADGTEVAVEPASILSF